MNTVNVSDARKGFAALLTRVAYNGERIILERHGRPLIAWISIEDLRRLERLEQEVMPGNGEQAALLAQAAELRRQILAARGGQPLPDSVQSLRQLRDES